MNKVFTILKRNSYRIKYSLRNKSTDTKNIIDGIFPPICTPFLPLKNEPIAWSYLESNLNKWEKIPFRGFKILFEFFYSLNPQLFQFFQGMFAMDQMANIHF